MRNRKTLTETSNNPFAIKQVKPSKWVGLVESLPNGFLKFDSATNGVRAGFINLYQTYILKGFNTIEKIFASDRDFPVYGDPGKGKLYTKLVSEFSGIAPDKVLNSDEVFKVGKAITRVESGKDWVLEVDFLQGFKMAKDYLGIGRVVNAWNGKISNI